jgi:hypothetical protein
MAKKNHIYTSVITGDLIKSRKIKTPKLWLSPLKKTLAVYGQEPKNWEIYRGDSFQVEVTDPREAFEFAVRIKAVIKTIKGLDVRMAIGIGTKEYSSYKLSESNGPAFINSGERLETLKKEKQNLAIQTPWPEFDKDINLYIRLALIAMNNWTKGSAELMSLLIQENQPTQQKLAKKLRITQSSISERMNRSYYPEIMEVKAVYQERIHKLIS